jgi:pyridoxine 5-phosphate synthase
MSKLGVNIDHIATVRQARREFDPDPIEAARICEAAGAQSIVCHLREDQRHIQKRDVERLRKTIRTRLNLEMALDEKIVAIAGQIRPDQATIVPERRQELTTEGGLDVVKHFRRVREATEFLHRKGIVVSLFINPDPIQINRSAEAGISMIEFHTGQYAAAKNSQSIKKELKRLQAMTRYAQNLGLIVNAGHGLKYHNTRAIALIPGIEELNIGHSIISRAVFVGLANAVKEMLKIVR